MNSYISKHYIFSVFALTMLGGISVQGQDTLSLEECRQRALSANRGLKQAEMKKEQTAALEKVALWQMLPKVSANGAFTWTEKSVNLLSEEQKKRLNHMGDNIQTDFNQSLHNELGGLNIGMLNIGDMIADGLSNVLSTSGMTDKINAIGGEIVDGLATDTRRMNVATVTLTQPLYMGGKLVAAYRTARLMNHLSGVEYDKKREETLIAVDEAYWQVVSVEYKKELAEKYAALLDTLEHNVELAVEAEMATKGDLAKVRVKRNEAQMSLTKATNGLILAKMLLAERCGMPLEESERLKVRHLMRLQDFETSRLHDHSTINYQLSTINSQADTINLDEVYSRRSEMQMLRIADSISREGVRLAASTLKPNIGLTGGYLISNPNVFDGFRNEWGGTWMAGVVVNVPILHPGGIYAVKAAKAKRREVAFQMEEAKELIELQVCKLRSELELAYKKLEQAESAMAQAEENLRLADEAFKAGMCSSSDLMMAQTAWEKAQSEIIDAKIEIEMSKVYLNQALGM